MTDGLASMLCTEALRTNPSILNQVAALELPGGLRMFRPMIQNISDLAYAFDTDGILRNTHSGETLSMKVTFTGASLRRQELIRAMCIRDVRQRLFNLNMQLSSIPIPGCPTSCIRVLHSKNLFTHRGPVLLVLQGGAMSQIGVWATRLLLHPQHGLRSGSQIDLVRKAHELGYAVALIHGGDYGPNEAELDTIELISALSRPFPQAADCVLPGVKQSTTQLTGSELKSNVTDPTSSVSTAPCPIPISDYFPVPPLDSLGFASATGLTHQSLDSLRSVSSSALFSLLLSNFNTPEDNTSKPTVAPVPTHVPPSLPGCNSSSERPSLSHKTLKTDSFNSMGPASSTLPAVPSCPKVDAHCPKTSTMFMGSNIHMSDLKQLEDFAQPSPLSEPNVPPPPDLLTSAGLFRKAPTPMESAPLSPGHAFQLPAAGGNNESIRDISVEDQLYGVWRQLVPRLLSNKLVIWAHQQGGVGLVHPLRPMPGVFDGFLTPQNQFNHQKPSATVDFPIPTADLPNAALSSVAQNTSGTCYSSAKNTMKCPSITRFGLPLSNPVNPNLPHRPTSMASTMSSPIHALQQCSSTTDRPFSSQFATASTSKAPLCASPSGKLKPTRKRHMSAGQLLCSARTRFTDRVACGQHTASRVSHIKNVCSQIGGMLQTETGTTTRNNKSSLLNRSPIVPLPTDPAVSNRVPLISLNASNGLGESNRAPYLGATPKSDESNSLRLRLAIAWQKKARRLQDELITRVKGIVFTECPEVLNLSMEGVGWGAQLLAEDAPGNPSTTPPAIFKPFGSCLPSRVLEIRKWLSENSVHYVAADSPLDMKLNSIHTADHEIPVLSAGTTEHDLIPSVVQDAAFAFFQKQLNAQVQNADSHPASSVRSTDNLVCSPTPLGTGLPTQATSRDSLPAMA
ncbi:hypothetical protein CRM22_001087 [Opisthorchis felineus]|uniref:Arb2 domain-containing protein n=1 Tax=Opisthorchis felineus TaxID=147828 RepID=A0A4S2MC70_OPIFE|nr:hypothetical protein CRM22_001087 [Opisthorchis felineus]